MTSETSRESQEIFDSPTHDEAEAQLLPQSSQPLQTAPSFISVLGVLAPPWGRRRPRRLIRTKRTHRTRYRTCFRGSAVRKLVHFLYAFLVVLFSTILVGAVFYPSYTHFPRHYRELRDQVKSSSHPGRGNPRHEKIFIAASIRDRHGSLAGGIWAEKILDLVELLGPDNVFRVSTRTTQERRDRPRFKRWRRG